MGIKAALPKYEIYFYNTVLCLAVLWSSSWIFEVSSCEYEKAHTCTHTHTHIQVQRVEQHACKVQVTLWIWLRQSDMHTSKSFLIKVLNQILFKVNSRKSLVLFYILSYCQEIRRQDQNNNEMILQTSIFLVHYSSVGIVIYFESIPDALSSNTLQTLPVDARVTNSTKCVLIPTHIHN